MWIVNPLELINRINVYCVRFHYTLFLIEPFFYVETDAGIFLEIFISSFNKETSFAREPSPEADLCERQLLLASPSHARGGPCIPTEHGRDIPLSCDRRKAPAPQVPSASTFGLFCQ